jgi:fatty acid desaturase
MMPLRQRGGAMTIRDDDQLSSPSAPRPLRWNSTLVWFMRALAAVWLVKGLFAWGTILGINLPAPGFEARTTGFQAAMIYFAVIDLVAAVGLWLTSTWGGVLWLLAVMSHLILAVFFPRFVSNGSLLIALFILSIMVYLTVSWLAAIEE